MFNKFLGWITSFFTPSAKKDSGPAPDQGVLQPQQADTPDASKVETPPADEPASQDAGCEDFNSLLEAHRKKCPSCSSHTRSYEKFRIHWDEARKHGHVTTHLEGEPEEFPKEELIEGIGTLNLGSSEGIKREPYESETIGTLVNEVLNNPLGVNPEAEREKNEIDSLRSKKCFFNYFHPVKLNKRHVKIIYEPPYFTEDETTEYAVHLDLICKRMSEMPLIFNPDADRENKAILEQRKEIRPKGFKPVMCKTTKQRQAMALKKAVEKAAADAPDTPPQEQKTA